MKTISAKELTDYIDSLKDMEFVTIARCPICGELFKETATANYQEHLKSHLN
jgi:uncharacterized C2H2 Zn-finger protein